MAKSPDAFRTISEVAEWLDKPAHVLRFWESKFAQVKPVKRAGGRRYYRPDDMLLLGGIKKLLHDDGMTIKGVQKILREQGIKHVAALSQPLDEISEAAQTAPPLEVKATPEPAPVAEVRGTESAESGTVVDFRREPDEMEPTYGEAASPDTSEPEADAPHEATAAGPDDDTGTADAAPALPEPQSTEKPEPVADLAESSAPADVHHAPEPNPPEETALPAFLRAPMQPAPDDTDQPAPEATRPAAPAPDIVDVADVPAPDQIEAEPGLVAAILARRRPLSRDARKALAAAGDDLDRLRSRMAQNGKE